MSMRTLRNLCVVLFLVAGALPVLAAGDGGGKSNIFAGDIGNVFWTLVIFGLVVFVLGKFAWGPLLEVLQKREEFIRESLEDAKRDRDAAEARLREYEERLNTARAEATAIVEEGRRDAEVLRHRIEEDGREEAEKALARAKREIGIAKETAIKELYELSGKMAVDVASKVIGRELNAADHQRLIKESIAEIGQLESN